MEMAQRPENLTTCHYSCWALVKRGGVEDGKRPHTRMAFLVGTIAPEGTAVAVTGYLMDHSMQSWTKTPRRIEWSDIVKSWHRQPTAQDIERARKRIKPVAIGSVSARELNFAAA
jgi:hypothetical protein